MLAEAAESVATPQIRNVGTLAGNVCQRPWCWYFRNGFPCFKNGGTTCFSVAGENQFHAIFGGGPSYIVHPSDTAPALVALDATFRVVGPSGERARAGRGLLRAAARRTPRTRTCWRTTRCWPAVAAAGAAPRHAQHVSQGARPRSVDARGRQRGGRARDGTATSAAARASCSAASRRFRGGCRRSSGCWPASAITPELAAKAGEAAVAGARPLAKNGYKVPLTQAMVSRAIAERGLRNAD